MSEFSYQELNIMVIRRWRRRRHRWRLSMIRSYRVSVWRALHHITAYAFYNKPTVCALADWIDNANEMTTNANVVCRLCTASSQTTKQKNLFKTNQNIHFLFGFYLTFESNAHLYFQRRIGFLVFGWPLYDEQHKPDASLNRKKMRLTITIIIIISLCRRFY